MKRLLELVLLGIFLILVSGFGSAKTDLTLKITNIQEIKGELIIALYDKKNYFPKKGMELKKIILKIRESTIVHTIRDLPKKEYAVAVFQDENSDQKCNLNFFGIPEERFGFSNNFIPKLLVPNFDEVKFKLDQPKTLEIKLVKMEY